MTITTKQQQVNEASTLAGLASLLHTIQTEIDGECNIENVVDLCSLPTFGGAGVKNTDEVWSWDECAVLVANCYGKWAVQDRCSCGEATRHCICE